MVFEESRERGLERRPYDLPTANEVAVVYVGEGTNGDEVPRRDFQVQLRGGGLRNVSDMDKGSRSYVCTYFSCRVGSVDVSSPLSNWRDGMAPAYQEDR